MEIFSPRLKRLLQHSIGSFLFAFLMMVLAVALTYVEDLCREQNRPAWLVNGIEIISIMLFVTDSIAILTLCIKLLLESCRDVFRKDDEPE